MRAPPLHNSILVCLLVLASVVPGAVVAQGPILRIPTSTDQTDPDPQPPGVTLHIASRLALVDVTVTDAKGNPIHGLTQANFSVEEDGKPQTIASFDEFRPTTPPSPSPQLPPNVYTNLEPAPTSAASNILLLDAINTPPADLLIIKQAACKYLKSLPSGTKFAVLGLSTTLSILQGFTSDSDLLCASVQTMSPLNPVNKKVIGNDREWSQEQDERNRLTLHMLDRIALAASAIEGRKNLIWFSAGIPTIVMPASFIGAPEVLPDYSQHLARTTWLFNTAQIAIYPIAAFIDRGPAQLSLDAIAEATGGVAFYNTNDLAETLGKAIDRGASYYTLAYTPPNANKYGKHHTITVKVDQPGLNLVYRKGYTAEDPSTVTVPPGFTLPATPPETAAGMKLAMARSQPTSTEILFDIQVQPSTEPAKPTDPPIIGTLDPKLKGQILTRYSFAYALPARQINFTNTPDGSRKGSLEFDLAAYDSQGRVLTSLNQSIQLALTGDQYQQLQKGPFRFLQQLDLPAGTLFLRIGILDAIAHKSGTLEIPVSIPK